MTKTAARSITAVAFVALIPSCGNVLNIIDMLFHLVASKVGLGFVQTPYEGLMALTYNLFGSGACLLSRALVIMVVAAIPSAFIYRYLLPRDFQQICEDCAAHKKLVWTLFALFFLFSTFIISFSRSVSYVEAGDKMPESATLQ
ncbi:MAG: hypothetical protein IJU44_00845 [Kiritimatiellae bacterium]|nr:hypothetical protein [Kiritimatiellia bacterium]